MFELRLLRYFVAVAELNMSGALPSVCIFRSRRLAAKFGNSKISSALCCLIASEGDSG